MKMPFGKHAGVELSQIPEPYLRWLRRQSWVSDWLVRGVNEVLTGPAEDEEMASFTVQESGGVGQTVVNCDGEIIAWTTDPWVAQVICRLLNENEKLLYTNGGQLT